MEFIVLFLIVAFVFYRVAKTSDFTRVVNKYSNNGKFYVEDSKGKSYKISKEEYDEVEIGLEYGSYSVIKKRLVTPEYKKEFSVSKKYTEEYYDHRGEPRLGDFLELSGKKFLYRGYNFNNILVGETYNFHVINQSVEEV